MKKLINSPLNVVREMLEGAVALDPGLKLLASENVVIRSKLPKRSLRKVALISGGGSGHEPAHAGYVGTGMLTAAVAGDVFTSPSTDAVLAAIRETAGPAGAVLIVKNYTGDRLNFGLAAEMARAEGIPTEVVLVADDVALHATVERERRRGIAGTVLVHKIAGASAEKGAKLAEVSAMARLAAKQVGSMGVSLGSCTLPNVGRPSFELGTDEIELGLGIHGEPGVKREKMASSSELVGEVLKTILRDMEIKNGARLALLVNGLGATPPMELAVVFNDAKKYLFNHDMKLERAWCGTFLSALDMPGFSLSVMEVDKKSLQLLDAATDASAWTSTGKYNRDGVQRVLRSQIKRANGTKVPPKKSGLRIKELVLAAANGLIAQEAHLTDLDAKAGDGDLGTSMSRGSFAIVRLPDATWTTATAILNTLSQTLRRAIGGSSGPFYATALLRAARTLPNTDLPTAKEWAAAFQSAVDAISELGGAKAGDRTMIDALGPAALAFERSLEGGDKPVLAWFKATEAAKSGCDATAKMKPRLGRASYLGGRAVGIPDAGAAAVVCWMEAIAKAMR
jgi:ATP-dependent dihydroxyacetone kinase